MRERIWTYLGVVLAIFKRDLWRVLRNPVALIVTLGMILMPSAYAWYVIAANWNPYDNTEGMLVAVANDDEGFDSQDAGELRIGNQVVEQLHDNHTIGWVFTDEQSAVNGVYSGEYWAGLVIPKGFSKDFASVLTGDFTQPTLDYYVNEKLSSIAPKVTDAAADAVEKAINESFVKTVTEKVVGITQEAGEHTESKAEEATSSLAVGVKSANETVSQTRSTFEGIASTVESAQGAASSASSSLEEMQGDIPHLLDAISQSKDLLANARDTTNKYGAELAQNAVTGAVKLSEAATVAQKALGTVRGDVATAESSARAALGQAESLLRSNQSLIDDLSNQASQAGAPAAVSQALADAQRANERLSSTVSALRSAVDSLSSTASALDAEGQALIDATQATSSAIRQAADAFQGAILPDIVDSLDSLVEACGTLEGAVRGLMPAIGQAGSLLSELSDVLGTTGSSLSSTSESLAVMEGNLGDTLTDLTALQGSATVKQLVEYLDSSPGEIGSFMAEPVKLETHAIYAVANYGSGVAPFFTNLALWVAGFILMAMMRLRVDPKGLPKFTATQAYFGRWLFYIVAGLLMGLVCCVGDLVMGIQCECPAAFVGAGLLTVFVDVNLMYGLAYASRHVGKAIAVLLLIMQIPGSSGMFPIEMMPEFYRAIHPLLPFTYSIDAMREAIGGFYGVDYLCDMLLLGLLFLPLGFVIGLGIGKLDLNLTLMFDEKLGETDLFVTEPVTKIAKSNADSNPLRYRTRTLIKALMNADAFKQAIVSRTAWFGKSYPKLRRIGWIALVVQPLATFAVMVLVHADVNTRIMMLVAMVLGIIVVDAYLMIISFANTSLAHQLALANMSVDDLQREASKAGLSNRKDDGSATPYGSLSAEAESQADGKSQPEDGLRAEDESHGDGGDAQ